LLRLSIAAMMKDGGGREENDRPVSQF